MKLRYALRNTAPESRFVDFISIRHFGVLLSRTSDVDNEAEKLKNTSR
ncbi:hypothetical protein NBRC3257_3187 [Gluconobacter thailandicus NBRC 3257]|uniref:Transposase n=1 Tax=Gluconobacter thailandicus NBRC 3257 TaxID=1381097 RepID=A0ABQ0J2J0_GLUTH|nr:hypothetical protein NBRC3255_2651 [Gluconobacter thailandicus NBRC 3255]GAD28188.1 hypothetical protein NBRC3257_3187 [Gluconobacter thailandicus NBRC 3257]